MATAAPACAPTSARDPHRILELTRELCAYPAAVVGEADEALFAHIAREVPLTVHRYPSGAEHLGWRVPELARVRRARIMRDGEVVLDGSEHPLVVAMGSLPFTGELDLEELRPHLVTDPARPDAYVFHCQWQYRPWQADWALSIPYARYRDLAPGRYRVELEIDREPGEMLVGVAHHAGDDPRTIVFNSHTCHPGQANDGMSGVATLIRLFQHLRGRRTRWSYRLVFGPEHLGTVFHLAAMPPRERELLLGGVFVEMTGVPSPLVATSTFRGGHELDRAFAHVLRHVPRGGECVGWREGAGNDETVWEAPGYEIPFVELTRRISTFAPYPEYHSSLDTPDSLHMDHVDEAYRALLDVVDVLERDCTVHRRFDGLVCLSSPGYDLYPERPDPAIHSDVDAVGLRWGRLVDHILRWMDGSMTALEMAEAVDLPFADVREYLDRFAEKGLAALRPATVARTPVSAREDDRAE